MIARDDSGFVVWRGEGVIATYLATGATIDDFTTTILPSNAKIWSRLSYAEYFLKCLLERNPAAEGFRVGRIAITPDLDADLSDSPPPAAWDTDLRVVESQRSPVEV